MDNENENENSLDTLLEDERAAELVKHVLNKLDDIRSIAIRLRALPKSVFGKATGESILNGVDLMADTVYDRCQHHRQQALTAHVKNFIDVQLSLPF